MARTAILQSIAKMINTKGKRIGTTICFLDLSENTEFFLWAHTCDSTRKVIIVDIEGMGTVQKEWPTNVTTANLEVYSVTQHAVGIAVNKQVKSKILAKRINVHIEHIKHPKSHISFRKHVKEDERKRRKSKGKALVFH